MSKALDLDLKRLKARAYHRAEWAEEVLRRYHSVILNLNDVDAQQLRAVPVLCAGPHIYAISPFTRPLGL